MRQTEGATGALLEAKMRFFADFVNDYKKSALMIPFLQLCPRSSEWRFPAVQLVPCSRR